MADDGIKIVIGIDLGDKKSDVCVIDRSTGELTKMRVGTTAKWFKQVLGGFKDVRTALEVGTHSPWVSRLLEEMGHEVLVANPRMLPLIYADKNKDDGSDCEKLAHVADFKPGLLSAIDHRSAEFQADLAVLRARDAVVRVRTKLINHVRGAVKSVGARLEKHSGPSFASKVEGKIPEQLRNALDPVLQLLVTVSTTIGEFDKKVADLNVKYPATAQLRQVNGVGPVTALAFVLILANPLRFKKSRDVGAYVGLVSRRCQSGGSDPELRITKAGDQMLRRYLVQAAQYITGPFGKDSDLRSFGLALAGRGRKNAKKRAVIAVARKLSVLLHRLWVTGKPYEPIRTKKEPAAPPKRSPATAAK